MNMFFIYLKLLLKKWYSYLGFAPGLIGVSSEYLPEKYQFNIPDIPDEVILLLTIFLFLCAGYKVWGESQRKDKSPQILIDHEFNGNAIYLEVKNIGNDYARNVKITFDPNIECDAKGKAERINDLIFFKNIPQLQPNGSVKTFFGSFSNEKYLQKFNIKISYYDLEERKIEDEQILEFKSFLGSLVPKKENEEIVKELQNISKNIKGQSGHLKNVGELLKEGVNIRNIDLQNYSTEDLSCLLKNIISIGDEEDMWLHPYIYDTRQLIKYLRNKMLAKRELTDDDKKILEQLNVVHKHHFYVGKDDKFKNEMDKLGTLL